MTNQRKAVFLDRDGVVNETFVRQGKPYPPQTLAELRILPGVSQAITRFKDAGYLIFVVTNQPDVRTGVQRLAVVEEFHALMMDSLAIDEIVACFHVDADDCSCRKPRPGMLLQLQAKWSICLTESIMVGDRWKDIDAGRAVGCRTVLIGDGYGEREVHADIFASDLLHASRLILDDS